MSVMGQDSDENESAAARRLRCPCCGASWCRCRECRARYSFGDAIACETTLHAGAGGPLSCRCGATVVDGTTVRTPAGTQLPLLRDVEPRRVGLLARVRARQDAVAPLERLVRAARRATGVGVRRRHSSTAA